MPRPKRTRDDIVEMQERILDAALEILKEEGLEGLSTRSIANHVGISHMSLYSYFHNHGELISALRDRQRKALLARRSDALERAENGDIEEILREVLEGYVSFAHVNPVIFHFLWTASHRRRHSRHERDRLKKGAREGLQDELQLLSDLIQIGIDRGVFANRDPFIAALTVSGMINGSLMMYQLPGRIEKEAQRKLAVEVVEAAMHYLGG